MRYLHFFIFIILLGGFVLSAPDNVDPKNSDGILIEQNKTLNHSFGKIFSHHRGLSEDCLKSIDKEQLSAVIHPTVVIKTSAASGKDRSLGLHFWQQLSGFKVLAVYPFFQSYLITSKDFITFKRILLYPKHSFW